MPTRSLHKTRPSVAAGALSVLMLSLLVTPLTHASSLNLEVGFTDETPGSTSLGDITKDEEQAATGEGTTDNTIKPVPITIDDPTEVSPVPVIDEPPLQPVGDVNTDGNTDTGSNREDDGKIIAPIVERIQQMITSPNSSQEQPAVENETQTLRSTTSPTQENATTSNSSPSQSESPTTESSVTQGDDTQRNAADNEDVPFERNGGSNAATVAASRQGEDNDYATRVEYGTNKLDSATAQRLYEGAGIAALAGVILYLLSHLTFPLFRSQRTV